MEVNDATVVVLVIIPVFIGLVVISAFLLKGEGADFIAGFNTLPTWEKDLYDTKKMCKFMGKIMLSIAISILLVPIGIVLDAIWIVFASCALILGFCLYAVIYANTGNRFKKTN